MTARPGDDAAEARRRAEAIRSPTCCSSTTRRRPIGWIDGGRLPPSGPLALEHGGADVAAPRAPDDAQGRPVAAARRRRPGRHRRRPDGRGRGLVTVDRSPTHARDRDTDRGDRVDPTASGDPAELDLGELEGRGRPVVPGRAVDRLGLARRPSRRHRLPDGPAPRSWPASRSSSASRSRSRWPCGPCAGARSTAPIIAITGIALHDPEPGHVRRARADHRPVAPDRRGPARSCTRC